jgi:hypothetical protein
MERFMDTKRTKEDSPLSYFQIAGPSFQTPISRMYSIEQEFMEGLTPIGPTKNGTRMKK